MQDGVFPLFPIDHVMPRVHTVKLLYLPVPDANATLAVAKLKSSLNRTIDALPILSEASKKGSIPHGPTHYASASPGTPSTTYFV